jgi:CRP/FNR family transcriptional regulator, cyclic AMP receptor protein
VTPIEGEERRSHLQKLANYALFERASASSIESLIDAAEFVRVGPQVGIIHDGQPAKNVYFVLDGVIRIYHAIPGEDREFTPKIMQAPNHFGDAEQIVGHPTHRQFVETVTESVLAIVPFSAIAELLLSDHQLCVGWLVGITSQFLSTCDADRHHVFIGVPGQVANLLLSYGQIFGEETRHGLELGVSLSREQIARHVGSVKRVVRRVVQRFVDSGWLDTSGRRLLIRDPKALEALTLPRRLGLQHQASTIGLLARE